MVIISRLSSYPIPQFTWDTPISTGDTRSFVKGVSVVLGDSCPHFSWHPISLGSTPGSLGGSYPNLPRHPNFTRDRPVFHSEHPRFHREHPNFRRKHPQVPQGAPQFPQEAPPSSTGTIPASTGTAQFPSGTLQFL